MKPTAELFPTLELEGYDRRNDGGFWSFTRDNDKVYVGVGSPSASLLM